MTETENVLSDYDESLMELIAARLSGVSPRAIEAKEKKLADARTALADRIDDLRMHLHPQYQLKTEGLP